MTCIKFFISTTVLTQPTFKVQMAGKQLRIVIVKPGKIVNLVVGWRSPHYGHTS